ncbi:MAG: T9SS type A sorting domain-containing protein, partial [Chlorobiales bacterium]
MKNRVCFLLLPFFLLAFLILPTTTSAQLSLTTSGSTVTIDFDNTLSGVNNGAFSGSGFQPSPSAGQLNSNAWAITGWSDGSLAFGGTQTSGDFARNVTTAAVTAGGVYAHDTLSSRRLMIQPSGDDWTPGTLTLRIQNNLGTPLRQIDIAYDLFVRNDQNRANSFNFSYSTDNATYTPVASMDYTSPQASVAGAQFQLVGTSPSRRIRIAGLDIPNGGFFYVRWSGDDVSGTGSRDEFAIDNIAVTGFNDNIIAGGTYRTLLIVGDPSGDRPTLAANITPDSLAIFPTGALDGLNNQILGTGSITISGRFVTQRSDGLSGATGAAIPNATLTLDSLSTIRYEASSGSQTVTGRNDYGNVEVAGASSKALSANTRIRGSLVLVASTLDVGNNTLTFRSGNTPIVRNGVTQTGTISFGINATLQFGDATSQLGSAFTIPNNCFTSAPSIQNLSIQRNNPITLGNQNIFTNTLTLTKGNFIVSGGGSTATGTIIISSDAPTAITGGSSTSHIRGTLRRVLQSNVAADGVSYFFPIADASGTYRPATLQNIRTGSGLCSMQLTAVETGASTFDASLLSIRSPYWLIQENDLPSNFTSATLELTGSSLINGENLIGASDNPSGTYSSIGGTVSGSTITSNAQALTLNASFNRYVAIGAFSTEPTVQASAISFTSVTANSFTINFTAGNGTNRLVVMRASNPVTFTPVDGTNYTGINSVFSLASNQDSDNNRIVFAGTGSSVNVSGLSGNTTYHVAIYEFNGTIANNSANFFTTSPPTANQTTIPNQPTQNVNTLTFSNFQTNALTLSWNVPSGDVGANRLVVVRAGSAPVAPSDFKNYNANTVFGSGDTTGTGTGFVVYNGNAPNTVTVTGLSPQTQYFFSIFEYNGSGSTANYNPSGASANRFTLKAEPTSTISSLSASTNKTQVDLTWSVSSPFADSILIVARIGSGGFSSGFPQDGTGYAINQFINFADKIRVVGRVAGSVNTFSVTGLASNTLYSFLVLPYNINGSNAQTANYFIAGRAEIEATTIAGTIYTWIGGNGSWTTPGNWSPSGPPSDGDLARFNAVGTVSVTDVPATPIGGSIGGIDLLGNSTVTLSTNAPAKTVTLTGFGSSAGNALNISSSSQLNLGGGNALTLAIQSGNTGQIDGTLEFGGAVHRLTSPDSASIIFAGGSEMIATTGFTGNAFGTTNLNSVIFQNGSTYRQRAGANPFGAAQPNSVVIFEGGSTYSVEVNLMPSVSGRTYANFEINFSTFNQTVGGAYPFTVDSLIVNAGSLTINSSGGFIVRGNIAANAGTTTIGSTSTPVTFSGASLQKIHGAGTLTFGANATITLNKPDTLRLERNVDFQNTLTLTQGILDASFFRLRLAGDASVAGGNDASYVIGTIEREFNTTPTARLYPFGSFGRYRPISILGNTSSGTSKMSGQLFDANANLREYIADPPNRVSQLRYYGFQITTGGAINIDQIPVLRANVDDGIGSFLSNTSLRVATAGKNTGWTLRNLSSPPNTTTLPFDLSSETGLSLVANASPDSALFALGSSSNTDNPLPVELIAYTGESTTEGAVLEWHTASETDNVGFTILKNDEELASFANTPSLRGRGTTLEETRYRFVDPAVKVGEVHRYQLRQSDLNGMVHDLGTVTLTITKAVAPREYSLSQNYPNPFNPTTTITYSLKAPGDVKLELFDVLGRKVATLVNGRQEAGAYTYSLNAARYGLSTGMYFYRLQSGGFVATKKMLLV